MTTGAFTRRTLPDASVDRISSTSDTLRTRTGLSTAASFFLPAAESFTTSVAIAGSVRLIVAPVPTVVVPY